MQRLLVCLVIILLATVALGDMLLYGNFIILYSTATTANTVGSTTYPTFIEEFNRDGSSVQSFEITSTCSTTDNPYVGAPRMSSDEQHISFPCYIPNGPTSNGLELISTIALLETNGTIDTSTKFSSNQIIYRALKTGNIIYFSGNFLVGYSTVGSNDFVSLVADIKQVQDVYVYDGNLLASNWDENPWGMATIGSGLPLTTAGQTATLYWTVNLVRIPTSVLFFENGNGKFAYMTIDYPSAALHRLKYENSEWVIEYKTSYNFGTGAIPTSTIFYDNGDGMTIVLMATSHKIYKITDTGTSLTSVTEIVSRPNVLIKGIEWAPSTIYLGGEPETVPNEPEAAPVPSTDPVAAPLDEPAAPVANTPSSNGPISSSPVTPSPNAPISDQTPADGPIETRCQMFHWTIKLRQSQRLVKRVLW